MREAGYEVGVTALDAPMLKDVGYDVFLDDAEVIEVGRLRLNAIHTPATRPARSRSRSRARPMLFTGDTLFPGGPGNTKFPGGDFATIIQSIDGRLFTFPTTRSCCPATAPTRRSAPSARTSRSGSTGAGDQLIQAVPRKRRCISAARAVIQTASAAQTPTIPSEG